LTESDNYIQREVETTAWSTIMWLLRRILSKVWWFWWFRYNYHKLK